MIELLSTYTITQILIFVIALAGGIKVVWDLFDFFKKKADNHYNKDKQKEVTTKEIFDQIEKVSETIKKVSDKVEILDNKIEDQQDFLDLLIESDKDQLKSLIVNRYHHFMAKGWIDDFSMDSLEKNFQHYKDEGGNSYVHDLMDELRRLPHHPKN